MVKEIGIKGKLELLTSFLEESGIGELIEDVYTCVQIQNNINTIHDDELRNKLTKSFDSIIEEYKER